jgi:general secretion pathway protein K
MTDATNPHACCFAVCAAPRGGRPCLGRPGAAAARPRIRQRGAALLLAMLTVTLVASFAAAAAWQQWRAVEVETAERARVQSGWILVGALDWARLILREDARSGGIDHLAEPWAVPLQEARLSSFLAADKNNTELSPDDQNAELFLSGQVADMQARLNVTNLIEGGKVSEPALRSWAKLFDLFNLDQRELLGMVENLRLATDGADTANTPLQPQRVDQLVWLGLPATSLEVLRPFITLLPSRTSVNLNTAPAEVLYASIPTLELAGARAMVQQRSTQHFRTLTEAGQAVPTVASQISDGQHSVASNYFEVRGRLRLNATVVQERSLVQRTGLDVKTLWRERATLAKFESQASLQ